MEGKDIYNPRERTYLVNNQDLEILQQYNAEIRGIYNYYCIANNATVLNAFYYIMKYSMFKTFAQKYKSNIGHIRKKFGHKRFAIKYKTKKGESTAFFYDEGFRRMKWPIAKEDIDNTPFIRANWSTTGLLERLAACRCEWCGAENCPTEVHHINKLKNLSGKKLWEIKMIGRKRKTLILCHECHVKLHNGKLD